MECPRSRPLRGPTIVSERLRGDALFVRRTLNAEPSHFLIPVEPERQRLVASFYAFAEASNGGGLFQRHRFTEEKMRFAGSTLAGGRSCERSDVAEKPWLSHIAAARAEISIARCRAS
jgi:hypothetical protein